MFPFLLSFQTKTALLFHTNFLMAQLIINQNKNYQIFGKKNTHWVSWLVANEYNIQKFRQNYFLLFIFWKMLWLRFRLLTLELMIEIGFFIREIFEYIFFAILVNCITSFLALAQDFGFFNGTSSFSNSHSIFTRIFSAFLSLIFHESFDESASCSSSSIWYNARIATASHTAATKQKKRNCFRFSFTVYLLYLKCCRCRITTIQWIQVFLR